jgi:hypothetical protein
MHPGWTDLVFALLPAAPIISPLCEINATYRTFSSAPDSPKVRLIIAAAISARWSDTIIAFSNE